MNNPQVVAIPRHAQSDSADRPSQHQRHINKGWQAKVFYDDQFILTAAVIEQNPLGAEFRYDSAPFPIDAGGIITVNLFTQNRSFTKRAVVRQIKTHDDYLKINIEYVDHIGYTPDSHRLEVPGLRIDPVQALKIPANIAKRQKALPFIEKNNQIHVACCNQHNPSLVTLLERLFKQDIVLWECDEKPLVETLKRVYGENQIQPALTSAKPRTNDDTNTEAVTQGESLLYAAYMQQASDIHIDPGYEGATIRFRVDGQLEIHKLINNNIYVELISRLKVMAGLDIAEKRSPQDGRFAHQFVSGGRRIDVRVATLPTKYGERITMRLLAVQTDSLTLNKLGLESQQQGNIENFLHRIQGMMIMTGPTGSGKTTTLYAAIRMLLEDRNVNIITIEDPIEYEIAGVAQCEVDSTDKVSFAKALRSILRHDPDVIMIGEIRDRETADIAIKAALTGHMVLGTLHTNSAAGAVTRLNDMGIEPYLISAALRLSVAQRLLRRLCHRCSIPRPLTEAEAISINRPELMGRTIHDPSGCIYCLDKGYDGRIGLYEVLELNEQWARSVAEGAGEAELVEKMRQANIDSLLDDAINKLLEGKTSVSEVIQIASSW